jgi:hypothetical protein
MFRTKLLTELTNMVSKILITAIVVLFIVAHGIAVREMHARAPVDTARPPNSLINGD